MTKPITSVAVMMLYEEGKFLLEDPVSKYLPEFKNAKVLVKPAKGESYTIPATREITIRDLLRHTSGITYNGMKISARCTRRRTSPADCCSTTGRLATASRTLRRFRCCSIPGTRFEYSLGVDVLGRLVEVVSGKPLDEFFRTRIFEPLGMKDTYFFPPDNKAGPSGNGVHLLSRTRG